MRARNRHRSQKATLLAFTALAGLAGLASANPARAATLNYVTLVNASDFGNVCRLDFEVEKVFVSADVGAFDTFNFQAYNPTTSPPIVTNTNLSVTQTASPEIEFFTRNVSTTAQATAPLTVRIRDILSGTNNFGPFSTFSIDQTPLVTAGGMCAQLTNAGSGNTPPVVNAGPDQSVAGGDGVLLFGTATDADGDALSVIWNQTAGPMVTINNPSTLNPDFIAPSKTNSAQVLTFSLVADDGIDPSAADTVDVTVAANVGPTANAGAAQTVGSASLVTLDGSDSTDGDSDPLTYSWTQTSGPAVTLSGVNAANPTFTAPTVTTGSQTLVFSLEVSDGLATNASAVAVTVLANQAPVVDAGPDQTVAGGSTVSLAGTAADADGDNLTFNWVQTGGATVALQNATTLAPSFTAPARTNNQQQLTFELRVDDGVNTTVTDTVTITIPANQAPNANISGPTTVFGNSTVQLDGSGSSDPDGDALVYSWSQIGGPPITFSNPNSANPSFVAPAATSTVQTIAIRLVVADPLDATGTSTFRINIAANSAPIADAGADQTAPEGTAVTLDGSGSADADGDALTYSWTQISGPTVSLTGATTAAPTFTAPPKAANAQPLVFELVVNDGNTDSAPDQVTVTVPANLAPLADAGSDQSVSGNAQVTLDGSASSDPDGDALTYSWVQTSGPAVTLSDPAAAQPTFTAPAGTASVQTIVFALTVSDGVSTDLAEVEVSIAANRPPVAEAGPDQGPIDSGQTVTLDGSGSSDPDGDALTYTWTQVSGAPVTLNDSTSANPTFTAPLVNGDEDLVFQLVVNDGQVASRPDTVTIGVRAIGSITIIQRVQGSDLSVGFTSSLAALNGTIATSGGIGQLAASSAPAGNYTITSADLTAQGYALTDISCNDADSIVDLASRTVDLALSPSEDLVCTFTLASSRDAALSAISNFLTGRNALILSHQPDLQRRIDRLSGVATAGGSATAFGIPVPGATHLPVSATIDNRSSRASTSLARVASALGSEPRSGIFDIWAEAYVSRARIGSQEGSFRIFYAGADIVLNDDLLLGGLVQFDEFADRGQLEAGEAEGDGWMAGPYVTARLAPRFFVEARAAWGKSDNIVSPLGLGTEQFDTSRSLYSASLIGQFEIASRTEIRPELTIRHITENQKAFTDSFGVAIPAQSVAQGDVSFRPRISHTIDLSEGWTLRPFGEVEGIYTFGAVDNGDLSLPYVEFGQGFDQLRARTELGVDLFSPGSFRASLSGFHDGIGSSDIRSTGIHIGISFGF